MRILVDTNVYLDFFLKRDGFFEASKEFFKWNKANKNSIYVTSMSLRDIGYIATRFFHSNKIGKEIQQSVYCICTKVIGISADAAIDSLYSEIDDYEDSLLIDAAEEAMVDAIVTNNKKDYLKSKIPVFTPEEIIKFERDIII